MFCFQYSLTQAAVAAQFKTGFAYENLRLFKAIENAMGHSCTTFYTLSVYQRRLITLSAVIMARVRERWEKQLADILLSFK